MHPNFLWFLVALVTFWSVLLTVIFRLEKRMVFPYGALEREPYFGDPTGYGTRGVYEAVKAGFVLLGWARDIKGPVYKASYAMLVSKERDTFAVIGVGKILKMPLQATWLHTPSADGRSFYSTDHQNGVQIDLSRNWTNQLVPRVNFSGLLERHREWLKELGTMPRFFTPGREYEEFRHLRDEHFRSMERAGLIFFTDGSGTHFHYTFLGAAKTAIWSYFLGMSRQLSFGRFPRNA